MLTNSRISQGDVVRVEIQSIRSWGIWSTATIQAKGSDMAISSITIPDSRPAFRRTSGRFLKFNLR